MQMPKTFALFCFLLVKATHKNIKIGTPSGVVKLKPGQYISGRIKLALELEQSEREIRTSLKRLVDLGIISIKATSKFSIYTIEKYEQYQSNEDGATSKTSLAHDKQQKAQKTTSKNRLQGVENKEKNVARKNKTTSKRPANDQQTTTKQTHKHINIKTNTSPSVLNNLQQPVDNLKKTTKSVDNFSPKIIQFLKRQGFTSCYPSNKRLQKIIAEGARLVDFKNSVHGVPKNKPMNYLLTKMEKQNAKHS